MADEMFMISDFVEDIGIRYAALVGLFRRAGCSNSEACRFAQQAVMKALADGALRRKGKSTHKEKSNG